MPTRTYLTTPPGSSPDLDAAADGVVERWVPGLVVPAEPKVAARRWRFPLLVGVAVLLLALLIASAVRLVTDAQSQDPSLSASTRQR